MAHRTDQACRHTRAGAEYGMPIRSHTLTPDLHIGGAVRNAIKKVFYGLAGERSRLMNWPDTSPARSLSLVVG